MKHTNEACTEFEHNLSLYVGGDLDAEAMDAIERHLGDCAACRAREDEARSARDLLVSTLRVTERRGPDLWAGVRQGLITEGLLRPAAPTAPAPIPARPAVAARRPRLLTYAAATAAAVLVGFWLGNSMLSAPNDAPIGPRHEPEANNVAFEPEIPRGGSIVTPVSDTGGLRRLGAGERPMSVEASMYTGFPLEDGPLVPDPNTVYPASTRSPRGTH